MNNTVMSAALYVVATPIGNLADISRRAIESLKTVRVIAAEDTRRTRVLLAEIDARPHELIAMHDHNEAVVTQRLIDVLKSGLSVALVVDAGTPLVSDPGFSLVRACWQENISVVPVPGASSLTAALSVCPVATEDALLTGFLPAKAEQRRRRLEALLRTGHPIVFFEAPHRILATLSELEARAANRRVFLAREMTKHHETFYCDYPTQLRRLLEDRDQVRGEFVGVLEGSKRQTVDDAEVSRVMGILAAELSPAQAARIGAQLLNRKKSELYQHLRDLRERE